MKLSITIVNYNQKYFPRLCLESLEGVRLDGGFEVIACDNHSKDESIEFLRRETANGKIKLIESRKNVGYGSGHNKAAKKATGKYICILNTDITVEPDTLKKLVAYLEKNPDVGMVGPKLMYHNGDVQHSCRRDFRLIDLFIKRTFLKKWPFADRYKKYVMEDFDHNKTQEVDLITGAFMVMPKSLFDKIGGFDERFFLFMEDFDLCRKVRGEGKKVVYHPDAVATHYHKRLSEGSFLRLLFNKVSWLHLVSAIKYFWKWRRS